MSLAPLSIIFSMIMVNRDGALLLEEEGQQKVWTFGVDLDTRLCHLHGDSSSANRCPISRSIGVKTALLRIFYGCLQGVRGGDRKEIFSAVDSSLRRPASNQWWFDGLSREVGYCGDSWRDPCARVCASSGTLWVNKEALNEERRVLRQEPNPGLAAVV
jgi:hypothetical protein